MNHAGLCVYGWSTSLLLHLITTPRYSLIVLKQEIYDIVLLLTCQWWLSDNISVFDHVYSRCTLKVHSAIDKLYLWLPQLKVYSAIDKLYQWLPQPATHLFCRSTYVDLTEY